MHKQPLLNIMCASHLKAFPPEVLKFPQNANAEV